MTVPTLFDYFLGFDDVFRHNLNMEMKSPAAFPPFDLYEDGGKTVIEFALAGYSKENIKVTVENSTLKITANKEKTRNTSGKYLHQGIALRSFYKQFALSENAVVDSAEYKDGILKITVSVIVPDEKKPRQIPVI